MARDFYPRRETDILRVTANIRQHIELNPEALGLTSAQSESYALKQAAFAQLFQLCAAPQTRTAPLLAAKRGAAAELEAETRMLVRLVRAMPFVTHSQLADLGLTPRSPRRAAVAAPASAPVLTLLRVRGREVCIRLRDADHPDNSGKPRTAGWANLYAHVGKEQPATGRGWWLAHTTTRTRAKIAFGPGVSAGTKVSIMARWFSRRGEPGPASTPITVYLQAGVTGFAECARAAA